MSAWDDIFNDPRVRGLIEQEPAGRITAEPSWTSPETVVEELRATITGGTNPSSAAVWITDSQHAQRDRLRQICPPHLLRGGSWVDAWNNRAFSLTFANGSRVQFASSDQEAQTQAGISDVGVLWVDEECPREHFTENLRAMVNVPHSFWFMTYWPEQKYAWVRDYYDDAAAGKVPTVTVGPVITMLDNVHNLGEQAVSDFEASITPAEAKSRMGGEYAAGEDLVFGGLEIPTVAAV